MSRLRIPRCRLILGLALLAFAAPPGARADWKQFIPTPIDNDVFFEVFSSFERDHYTGLPTPVLWTDPFVRERLSLDSYGFSYDPRFLQYQLSLGVLLKQEDYESSQFDDLGWTYGEGYDYNVRLTVLPEHPYNVDLFAIRVEDQFREQSAIQRDGVSKIYGVSAQYREKPYFAHAGFVDNQVENGDSSSDVQKLNLDGQYFDRFTDGNEIAFNAAYNPSWFTSSADLDGRSHELLAGNLVNLQVARLSSDITYLTTDQSTSSASFDSDQFRWDERLTGYLPWNFRVETLYRYQDDSSRDRDFDSGVSRDFADHGYDVQFDLIHRLFQSLDSRYTLLDDYRASPGAKTSNLSNGLTMSYTKSIPTGRLIVGGNVARADTDSEGAGTDVVNEPHLGIAVPTQVFLLDQRNVDEASIAVFLRSPLAPFELVELIRDEQYVVLAEPTQNTFQIQVFTLPARFAVPGTYDFFVSYTLLAGDFSLRVDTFGSNATVELFDNLVAPYVSYQREESDVLSGDFPGYAIDSTTYTAGLRMTYGPFRLRGEYQDLEWEVSPRDAWRAELQYVDYFNNSISLFGSASYVNTHYREGALAYYPFAYTEDSVSVSGSITKRWNDPRMYLAAGGSFAQIEGLVDSRAFTLNGSWNWSLGLLDFSLGATGYFSESQSAQSIRFAATTSSSTCGSPASSIDMNAVRTRLGLGMALLVASALPGCASS
ncbi:MAG: hypothetical protein IPK07_19905 [Deltaproteobacteria bacterium]|nr:hypothetical protein [Deltaproteobacteria bacterium]